MSKTGFTAIPNHLFSVPGMDANTWALLNALAHYANKEGYCFPSQSTLGEDLGRSRAWVNKYISKLVEMGVIEKQQRKRLSDNGNTSCGYYIPALHAFFMSKSVTPPVTENDSNNKNQTNKNSLESSSPIDDWYPDEDTIYHAKQISPSLSVKSHISRFKLKVKAKGYNYKNLSSAWLLWIQEDTKTSSLQDYGTKPHRSHRDGSTPLSLMAKVLEKRGQVYAS